MAETEKTIQIQHAISVIMDAIRSTKAHSTAPVHDTSGTNLSLAFINENNAIIRNKMKLLNEILAA